MLYEVHHFALFRSVHSCINMFNITAPILPTADCKYTANKLSCFMTDTRIKFVLELTSPKSCCCNKDREVLRMKAVTTGLCVGQCRTRNVLLFKGSTPRQEHSSPVACIPAAKRPGLDPDH